MMTGNSEIKAVIFDLGRVLVDVDLSRGIFSYVPDLEPGSDHRLMKDLFKDPLFRAYGKGEIPAEDFARAMCSRLSIDLSFEEFKKIWCDIFDPMPGMEELVRKIAKKYRLGLLSDIGPLHWQYLKEHLSLLELFKQPQLSFQTGLLKPDKQVFLRAAEIVNTPPENCLFIDDLGDNVQGARQCGMKAIHFSTAEKLSADLKKHLTL